MKLLLAGAAALAKPVLSESDPETRSEASFSALHGLYWLTVNLAGSQPVLVTVDDAHWADLASLRWLIYLARRLAGVPLALVLATRSADPGPVQELHDELLVIPEIAVLEPGGLSEEAITLLAAQSLSAEPDPIFVTACQRATGGNPFLLLELFGELARRGIVPSRENADLAGQLSSQGVGRAVRSRLRRLPPGCIALARAVAVLGDGAEPILAAQLADLDGDEAARAADALAEAAILRSRPAARLRPYARALERLLRDELLGSVPEATSAPPAFWQMRARHPIGLPYTCWRPTLRGDAETVNTLRQAAKGARNRGAPDVAVTYLQRALAEPPSADLEPVLAHELGKAALSAGELEMAIEKLRTGNSRSRRWAAARRGGERARLGALPRTAAGGGDDRSHDGHRRVASQRARAGTAATGDALGGRAEAASRSGVASRQQASGSSSSPAHRGRPESACRSPRQRTRPLERGRRPRHASWPCRRLLTGGCLKIRVRSRAGFWIAPFVLRPRPRR